MVIRLHTFSAQLFTYRYTNHSPVLRICRNHDPQVFCSFCLVVDRDPDCQLSVLINTRSGHINCLCKYRPYCSASGIVSKQIFILLRFGCDADHLALGQRRIRRQHNVFQFAGRKRLNALPSKLRPLRTALAENNREAFAYK